MSYPRRWEVAHSISHGVGIVASIAGLTVLVAFSALHGAPWSIFSSAVFGTTLILLYTASTLYHSATSRRSKRVFKILDHAAIYLLIAGTYTPFTLVTLRGLWGWGLFALVWTLAIGGVVLTSTLMDRVKTVSLVLYVVMGWLAVVAFKPLWQDLPRGGLILLGSGGLCYTFGLVFYGWKRFPAGHFIWHLLVLAGSVLHYLAVLFYVIPAAR